MPSLFIHTNALVSIIDNHPFIFNNYFLFQNLEKDFATPQVVQKHLSRLSSQAYIASASCMKVFLRVRPFTDEEVKKKENQVQCFREYCIVQ